MKIYKTDLSTIKKGTLLLNEHGFTERVDSKIFGFVKTSVEIKKNKKWGWRNCGWKKISNLELKEYQIK